MTDPTVSAILPRLTEAQRDILDRLAEGRKLGVADRADDRARQGLRRKGLIAYCGTPMRWQISALGLSVRSALRSQETER
jgi:hypothetical protein